MKTKYLSLLLAAGIVPGLAGCISAPTPLALVGPDAHGRMGAGPEGYLEVFTATQTIDVDFHSYFSPHLGYDVNDLSGQCVKFVPNHTSDLDEAPDRVALPPGTYQVVAESTWCGLVSVPVVVQPGKTTVVHLDGNEWRPAPAAASHLVYLPNGEAVGWSGRSAMTAE
jgi:hypothetical protein